MSRVDALLASSLVSDGFDRVSSLLAEASDLTAEPVSTLEDYEQWGVAMAAVDDAPPAVTIPGLSGRVWTRTR